METNAEGSAPVRTKAGRKPGMVATPSGSAHLIENVNKPPVFHQVGLGDFPTEFQGNSEGKSHCWGGA